MPLSDFLDRMLAFRHLRTSFALAIALRLAAFAASSDAIVANLFLSRIKQSILRFQPLLSQQLILLCLGDRSPPKIFLQKNTVRRKVKRNAKRKLKRAESEAQSKRESEILLENVTKTVVVCNEHSMELGMKAEEEAESESEILPETMTETETMNAIQSLGCKSSSRMKLGYSYPIQIGWCCWKKEENDNFDFFLRIRIEMAFGLLNMKWEVLQKPLKLKPAKLKLHLTALARLHKCCINERLQQEKKGQFDCRQQEEEARSKCTPSTPNDQNGVPVDDENLKEALPFDAPLIPGYSSVREAIVEKVKKWKFED